MKKMILNTLLAVSLLSINDKAYGMDFLHNALTITAAAAYEIALNTDKESLASFYTYPTLNMVLGGAIGFKLAQVNSTNKSLRAFGGFLGTAISSKCFSEENTLNSSATTLIMLGTLSAQHTYYKFFREEKERLEKEKKDNQYLIPIQDTHTLLNNDKIMCPICYDQFTTKENPPVHFHHKNQRSIQCQKNNYYHKDCAVAWKTRSSTCPNCRIDLVTGAYPTT